MSAQLAQALRGMLDLLDDSSDLSRRLAIKDAREALAALEAAPQQEPAIIVTIDDLDLVQDWAESRLPPGTHKLYAAPQQAQAPIDPDGAESRAGFRAFDESQMARWATPWQVWREAVKWAARPAQQAQAPGWQPIETAPKDGSLLLLFERYEDEPFIGCWQYGKWTASRTHYDTDGNACVTDRVYSDGVSHWMPLPAAPQQGSNT